MAQRAGVYFSCGVCESDLCHHLIPLLEANRLASTELGVTPPAMLQMENIAKIGMGVLLRSRELGNRAGNLNFGALPDQDRSKRGQGPLGVQGQAEVLTDTSR